MDQTIYILVLIILQLMIIFFIIDRVLAHMHQRSNKHLHKKGKRVVAIITEIRQEIEERGPAQFPRINYCYYIEAEWTDIHTGLTYKFRSKRLRSKPKEVPGAVLSVLVDPEQPTNYAMELSDEHV